MAEVVERHGALPPPAERLATELIFKPDGKPNPEVLKAHFQREGRIKLEDATRIIHMATELYRAEPNLLTIESPVTVCGDVHGQYFDLMKLFEVGGAIPETSYLFLGDYVDRGSFSTEVCFYLFALKINFPSNIFMLRGNHECRHLTDYFNFKIECKHKYDLKVYDDFMECFDCLPLAANLDGKFFCVHGGLSPEVKTLEDVTKIYRFREPPPSGPMCDLLWADPLDESQDTYNVDFVHNHVRGCSYYFGFAAACNFLEDNGLLSILRAHEAQDEGYKLYKKRDATEFPTVITLFSAPNYCDVYRNKAAVLKFADNLFNIRQFNSSPHPYSLPNFMDVFSWSLPFVAEKVTEMLLAIMSLAADGEALDEEPDEPDESRSKERIKAKVKAVTKYLIMFKTLREESETICQLKGLVTGNKLPVGILQQGPQAIREAVLTFQQAYKLDQVNEARPPFAGGNGP
mmetsp:Transcript_36968/g.59832  ORF Transcript_36968/g.59832 Transcript_36968/m.59832 type:complete len:460 (+) Transcript_36968:150-1529(+)